VSKKQKRDPIQHEKDFIAYLEGHLKWMREQPLEFMPKEDIKKAKFRLDKARMVLKSLELKK
jgi:hypothetical protein